MPRKKAKMEILEDSDDNTTLSSLLQRKKGKIQLEAKLSATGTTSPTSTNTEEMERLIPDEPQATSASEASVPMKRKRRGRPSKSGVQLQETPTNRPPRQKAASTPKHKKSASKTTIQAPNTAVPQEKNQRDYTKSSVSLSKTKRHRKLDFDQVHELGVATIKAEPEGSSGASAQAIEQTGNDSLLQSKDYVHISSLKEAHRDWTLKVKVLRKGTVDKYNSTKGPGIYQKYLLLDNKGVVIQATIFNEDIAKLKDKLQRGMTYYLSNGFVKCINQVYANAHESLEIMLGPTTCVDFADTPLEDVTRYYKFIDFDELQSHMGPASTVDTIGLVVRVDPLSTIKATNTDDQLYKRDVILTNLRSQTIVFTLWADLATEEGEKLSTLVASKPVIAVSKAKVVNKNGTVSISSLVITTIEIDPEVLDTDSMKEWRGLDHQGSTSNYINIQSTASYEELKLNDLITRDFTTFKHSYYCFKGEIISITNEDAPWYNGCSTCNKKVDTNSTGCTNCGAKDAKLTKRYLLKLNVQDDTKKASITVFDVAEKIFGFPPSQMDLDSEDNRECIKNLKGRKFIFTVRIQKSSDTARKNGRFVAHDVQAIQE